jgi:predicted DNA-binding transcriptional regulator AlpA
MRRTAAEIYLDVRQVAKLLGCSPKSVRNWVKSGILPAPIRLGTGPRARKRWTRDSIDAAMQQRAEGSGR